MKETYNAIRKYTLFSDYVLILVDLTPHLKIYLIGFKLSDKSHLWTCIVIGNIWFVLD